MSCVPNENIVFYIVFTMPFIIIHFIVITYLIRNFDCYSSTSITYAFAILFEQSDLKR